MELWDEIERRYRERTPTSEVRYRELSDRIPAGVASTYRAFEPYPMVIDRADGPHLWDVDDNKYVDYDLNNGAGMVGHNHPVVTEAITDQLQRGTLYTHPHELLGEAAEAIADRWEPIDLVRFTNSGTEATMHAIRIARAYSGRDKLLKIEGAYHGAHDYVLASKAVPANKLGHPERPATVIESEGVPEAIAETIEIAPWNDLAAVEAILEENVHEIGALIVEPIVMNVGMTRPHGDFLEGLRDLCDEYQIPYIFDEVKTGVKIAPGGAAEYYGVEPDLVTMAKSIGGNYPVGAFGGREEIMREIEDGAAHFGTYNGNPLVLRAVTTTLNDVLTADAYDHVDALGERLAAGYEDIMADHGINGHVAHVNSQGIVHFTDEPIRTYRDFDEHVDVEFHENYWFAMLEHGVIPHPHHASQQWTISVQHEAEHIDKHLEAFKAVAPTLAERQ